MNLSLSPQEVEDLKKESFNEGVKAAFSTPFPFTYMGGGYFRHNGVPKGQKAFMLHGAEAIGYFRGAIQKNLK